MDRKCLLIVEDDVGMQKQLRWCLADYDVVAAHDRASAMALLRRHQPGVVTMDLGLPPDTNGASEGLALLQQMLAHAPELKVIVLTGNRERQHALKAVALGAYDFHHKPPDAAVLQLVVARAFYLHAMQQENRRLRQLHTDSPMAGLITRDPTMLKLCRDIEKVAPSSATVMVLGASGTGKELVARGLHAASTRRKGRFVAINCAAIPETLLESELFGYERGAFTGAQRQTPGKVELAHEGTLFLDEIGDMAVTLQAKLLRFLQQRSFERVGGRQEIAVDVRVICATHQDLKALAAAGRFREDLYYRLSEVVLTLPPLRGRTGDAVLLAQHFLHHYCASEGRGTLSFSAAALAAIEAHTWPGNVRELAHCVRRAVIMGEGPHLGAADLGLAEVLDTQDSLDLRQARDAAEYRVIVKALGRVDGNIARAAELLGISRPTLYDLMNHHGLKQP